MRSRQRGKSRELFRDLHPMNSIADKRSVSPVVDTSEIYRGEAGKRGVICGMRVIQGPFGKIKIIHPNGPAASRPAQPTPGHRAKPDAGLPTGG
jgi:hypothetical protein